MECFDADSGQVFLETIVRSKSSSKKPEWQHRCTGRKPDNELSKRGASPLKQMALGRLVCEAKHLQPEVLRELPSQILDQIWAAVKQHSRDSLHVWKIFIEGGCTDRTFMHSTQVPSPVMPPSFYCLHLNSAACTWLTDLTLLNTNWSSAEVKQLALLDNLRSLYVGGTGTPGFRSFDENALRSISARAEQDGAFSRLKVIFVERLAGINAGTFDCLSRFPQLDTFCSFGAKIKRDDTNYAASKGWKEAVNLYLSSSATPRTLGYDSEDDEPLYPTFQATVQNCVRKMRSQSTESVWNRPFVDVVFGRAERIATQPQDLRAIHCFQRDRKNPFQRLNEKTATTHDKTTQAMDRPSAEKKRKIKDGKAVDLDSLLNGL